MLADTYIHTYIHIYDMKCMNLLQNVQPSCNMRILCRCKGDIAKLQVELNASKNEVTTVEARLASLQEVIWMPNAVVVIRSLFLHIRVSHTFLLCHQIATADAEARAFFAKEAQQLREQLDHLNTEHSNLLALQQDALSSSSAAALQQQVGRDPL